MFDVAMRKELAAMVRDRVEDAFDADEERPFLVLAEDCEELTARLHAVHTQGLLPAG
jgi:hypothetical protein